MMSQGCNYNHGGCFLCHMWARNLMALPMANSEGGYGDEYSERANSLEDYKVTCIDFVKDISKDYLAWVDYYKLESQEDEIRRRGITSVIGRADEWISKVAQSIRGVDVVMNDAIQKMAEATAGKPFPINITVDGMSSYARAKPGRIAVNVMSSGRNGKKTLLGSHSKDGRFRIESTFETKFAELTGESPFDASNMMLEIDATKAAHNDVVSFTVIVEEHDERTETERRGATTLVHIN